MASKKRNKEKIVELNDEILIAPVPQPRPKALVFISHDTRNANLAEAFANLLSDVSGGTLKSFRSSDKKGTTGIEFGAEWYGTIMAQLSDATDVVALLTVQSLDRPWILYEAGVAKGKLDTTLFGLAIGVPLEKVSAGPFGQFQNCGDDEDSLTKLVMQLLARNPDAEPREEAIRTQVKIFSDKVAKILSATPKGKIQPSEEQNIAKLFEEVKAMVKEIPEQLDGHFQSITRKNRRTSRRLHPGLLRELLYRFGEKEFGGAANAFLGAVALYREDFPWLYEIAREIAAAYDAGERKKLDAARERFMRSLEFLTHSKISYELLGDERESYRLRESIDVFGEYLFGGPLSKPLSKPVNERLAKKRLVS